MKKHILPVLPYLILIFTQPLFASDAKLSLQITQELKEPFFLEVLPFANDQWIALSPQNLYRFGAEGEHPNRIFNLSSPHEFKRVVTAGETIFLLSDEDLWMSDDLGERWKNISPLGPKAVRSPKALRISQGQILLGTAKGLYQSAAQEINFKPVETFPRDEAILEIQALSPHFYFVLTDRSLWKTRDGGMSFEKLLGNIPDEIEKEKDLGNEKESEPNESFLTQGSFTSLEIDSEGKNIWVGSKRGIFQSQKGGLQFGKISSSGLRSEEIIKLVLTPSGLAATTEQGAYLQKENHWESLYPELDSKPVYDLSVYRNQFLIASEGGIYSAPLPPLEVGPMSPQELHFDSTIFKDVENLMHNEPSVLEVQKAAIRYSNTRNGKIRSWQILSRLQALVPDVAYTIGKSQGNTIDLDRAGTANPDIYITGPESWDKDKDISVRWDLGEFLFSSAQTSIDSRDKLMVELRDEIVSEITRLYFERRRLQIDLLIEKPEGKPLLDTWLRIEELTAQIDGLTGGFFSKKIKRRFVSLKNLFHRPQMINKK